MAGEAFDAAVGLLAGLPLSEVGPAVVGHGDPNLANYLWDGVRVRVVDFEDAGRSDVAYELATLVEHLSARGLDAEAFCDRFEVDPVRLRAARRNPPGTLDAQAVRLLALADGS